MTFGTINSSSFKRSRRTAPTHTPTMLLAPAAISDLTEWLLLGSFQAKKMQVARPSNYLAEFVLAVAKKQQ